ncbi:MAG TPA: hypothetical protein VEQ59_25095 [Polyangiaceae bacterium]|nr:hypothetical protein [Polyangiaceae bacterium]
MSLERFSCTLIVMWSALGCGEGGEHGSSSKPLTCDAQRVTQCPDGDSPVYADVQPIFEQTCASAACHSGFEGGPWPLDNYSHVADWQDVIRDELLTCAMPPPDSGVSLAYDQRQRILTWIRCGYRE